MSKIVKVRKNSIPNLNVGLSIIVQGQKAQLSGLCPSPSFKDELELLKALVTFVNKKLGTKYKIVAG